MKFICLDCAHQFEKEEETAWQKCPMCGGDAYWEGSALVSGKMIHDGANRVPAKGSEKWYKERWFRRSTKEWHADIRSRVASPDGKIVRRQRG